MHDGDRERDEIALHVCRSGIRKPVSQDTAQRKPHVPRTFIMQRFIDFLNELLEFDRGWKLLDPITSCLDQMLMGAAPIQQIMAEQRPKIATTFSPCKIGLPVGSNSVDHHEVMKVPAR